MRAIMNRSRKPLQLLIVLTFFLLVFMMIWKLFISKDKAISEDYQTLAMFSPDEIILYQKAKPVAWKDYIAILATFKTTPDQSKELENKLLNQLDHNVMFKQLDWSGIDKNVKRLAQDYRILLDKYTIYTPGKYGFPLHKSCYYIDTFGADREGGERSHQGTDLFDKKGTPVISVCPGSIEKLGWNRLGGERVGVRGDDGNYYYYAHLDKINPELFIDKRVETGDYLGTMGNTGDAISTPDHLHFGIELSNGEWLNPYPFLKVWENH